MEEIYNIKKPVKPVGELKEQKRGSAKHRRYLRRLYKIKWKEFIDEAVKKLSEEIEKDIFKMYQNKV